jgi:josephin
MAESSIYHEKQSKLNQLCLVHAINMMIGAPKVDKQKLDQVCEELSPSVWWNPHRSPFGLGNFDANVAMVVFNEFGYESSFFDSRRLANDIPLEQCVGLLLNVKGSSFLLGSRHWVVYKESQGAWYLLDSRNDEPKRIDDILTKIQSHIDDYQDHVLIVQKKES